MNRFFAYSLFVCLFLAFSPSKSRAEVVEIPEEELSQETVLPKFDFPESVKNRVVVTAKKIELGTYLGFNISEPIYGQGKFGINLGYHLSETAALVLNYAKWNGGLNTQYTDGLEIAPNNLDFTRIPKILDSTYLHYEANIFYGKISFTKDLVANNTIYPIFGIGQTRYQHKSYKGIDFGIGQKVYFGSRFGLRADFKFQYSEAPSPFLGGRMQSTQPKPEPSDFRDRWVLSSILDLGLTILF